MAAPQEEIGQLLVVNPARGPIRALDRSLFAESHFVSQMLYDGETIQAIVSSVPAGADGPPAHKHPANQLFYTLDGELELDLGTEHYTLSKGALAYIPAGAPHRHRNAGTSRELHLELMLGPPTHFGPPIVEFVDDDMTAWEPGGTVAKVNDGSRTVIPGTTFVIGGLIDPTGAIKADTGVAVPEADGCVMYEATVEPGSGMGVMHYHTFDQIYYVTEGDMTVTLGLDEFEVGRDSLVILPAYVPHRNANRGPGVERHVAINVPAPTAPASDEAPWDVAVDVNRRAR